MVIQTLRIIVKSIRKLLIQFNVILFTLLTNVNSFDLIQFSTNHEYITKY